MRVGPAAARYLTHQRQAGKLAPETVTHRRRTLRTFEQSVGSTPVDRLDRRHVERWLTERGRSPGTKRQYLVVVRSFAKWLVRQGYMNRDFTFGVEPPPLPRRRPRALTIDQVRRILSVCETRERLCTLLMAQEGLRVGEVARLEVGDIDVARRSLGVKGKGGHERQLPISDETWSALVSHLGAGYWPAGPVIRNTIDGSSPLAPMSVSRLVTQRMRAAEVPGSPHALRHTALSDVLEACGDIMAVKDMAGHASISTTQDYLRNTNAARLRDVMAGRRYG